MSGDDRLERLVEGQAEAMFSRRNKGHSSKTCTHTHPDGTSAMACVQSIEWCELCGYSCD